MVNLGFIGVGGYGRAQLEGFLPLQKAGRVCIKALADPNEDALKSAMLIEDLGKPDLFSDYQSMLKTGKLDAVVVSAPIPLHREIATLLLKYDLFILLEKPPVPLLSELEELIALDRNRRVMVGFQHIYSDLIHSAKERFWGGDLGRPLSISAWGVWPRTTQYYQRAGWAGQLFWKERVTLDGPCTNALAHFLNMALFLAGEAPSAFGVPVNVSGEVYRARPIATYDTGVIRGETKEGVRFSTGFSHAGESLVPVALTLRGTAGDLVLSDNARRLTDPTGACIDGEDGRTALRSAFIDFAEGNSSRNLTDLASMRPYVATTNLMFASSGGIHPIPENQVTCVAPGTEEAIYAVSGLPEYLRVATEQGIPLRQAGAPWGVVSEAISFSSDFTDEWLSKLV